METPERHQGLKRLRTLYVCGRNLACASTLITGLAITGCGDSGPSTQAGIYGVYEGTSADYTHGGAAAPVVDNGFSVDDGMKSKVSVPTSAFGTARSQASKGDSLTGSTSDTLIGKKGTDTLQSGGDALSGDDGNSSSADSLTSTEDLDNDPGGAKGHDPMSDADNDRDDNFFSYKLKGYISNSTLQVLIDGRPIVLEPGTTNIHVSDYVKHGINRATFIYTPVDSTSEAIIGVIRVSSPQLPTSAAFDSHIDVNQASEANSVTKIVYFLGQ
jgi:hypothetical protein